MKKSAMKKSAMKQSALKRSKKQAVKDVSSDSEFEVVGNSVHHNSKAPAAADSESDDSRENGFNEENESDSDEHINGTTMDSESESVETSDDDSENGDNLQHEMNGYDVEAEEESSDGEMDDYDDDDNDDDDDDDNSIQLNDTNDDDSLFNNDADDDDSEADSDDSGAGTSTNAANADNASNSKQQQPKKKKVTLPTIEGQTEQQATMSSIMGSLLSSNRKDHEPLSKARKDKAPLDPTTKAVLKRKREEVVEVVDQEGKVIKKPKEEKKEKKPVEEVKPAAEEKVGKRHFPLSKRIDPFCLDPRKDTDVVKEKKLKGLATQGVVQLFNTLEQMRHQDDNKKTPSSDAGRCTTGTAVYKQPTIGRTASVSAITTGKSGLIQFLNSKKSSAADRPLFNEGR